MPCIHLQPEIDIFSVSMYVECAIVRLEVTGWQFIGVAVEAQAQMKGAEPVKEFLKPVFPICSP